MTKDTRSKHIIINGISVEIEKKKIKNMYLKVLLPDGRVRITAPVRMPEEAIKVFVLSKQEWIKQHQERLLQRQAELSAIRAPEYITGERVQLWGNSYLLEVIYGDKQNSIVIEEAVLKLKIRQSEDTSTVKQREKLLQDYYRDAIKRELPYFFERWQKIIGVRASDWYIRDMKTRWGTCNIRSKRICMNLRLAMKDKECLEYVVVHELVHLLEKSHNQVFKAYMDQFLPGWRVIKARLNKANSQEK